MSINLTNIPAICLQNEILGCTYDEAANFNPNATFEDGSCVFNLPNPAYEFIAFGTHYQQCVVPTGIVPNIVNKQKASFLLFIQPSNTSIVPFEVGDLIVVRAFAYQHLQNGTSNVIRTSCSVSGSAYIERPTAIGNQNRFNQGISNVWAIPYTPTQAEFRRLHIVEATQDDTNLDFFASPQRTLPLEISVIKKNPNRVYTGIITINLYTYFNSIDYSQQKYTI